MASPTRFERDAHAGSARTRAAPERSAPRASGTWRIRCGTPPKGTRVARQCLNPWIDTYEKRISPKDGADYYWNNSIFTLGPTDSDTDVAALREGYITVTPLSFDLTDHASLSRLAPLNRSGPAHSAPVRDNQPHRA